MTTKKRRSIVCRPCACWARLSGFRPSGACTLTDNEIVTASVPVDYRQRHPIAIHEGHRPIVVFVGHGRGSPSTSQRVDVAGLAQSWIKEGPQLSPTYPSRRRTHGLQKLRSVKSGRYSRLAACLPAPSPHKYHPT